MNIRIKTLPVSHSAPMNPGGQTQVPFLDCLNPPFKHLNFDSDFLYFIPLFHNNKHYR